MHLLLSNYSQYKMFVRNSFLNNAFYDWLFIILKIFLLHYCASQFSFGQIMFLNVLTYFSFYLCFRVTQVRSASYILYLSTPLPLFLTMFLSTPNVSISSPITLNHSFFGLPRFHPTSWPYLLNISSKVFTFIFENIYYVRTETYV